MPMLARPTFKRRPLSMTPLIDVIFLLLLFFMLSSTFSKFSELELTQAGSGGAAAEDKPWFLELSNEQLRLNGNPTKIEDVAGTVGTGVILVSLENETTSQRLIDLLAALRGIPDVKVTVLE